MFDATFFSVENCHHWYGWGTQNIVNNLFHDGVKFGNTKKPASFIVIRSEVNKKWILSYPVWKMSIWILLAEDSIAEPASILEEKVTQLQPGISCGTGSTGSYCELVNTSKRSAAAPTASFITFTEKRAKNGTKHFNLLPAGFGWVGRELLPQAREFKYLVVLFTNDRMEQEMDRRTGGSICGVAGAVPDSCGEEIYRRLCSYPHLWCELWVVTKTTGSQIQAAEKKTRVAGFSLTDREMGGGSE